MEFGDGEVRPGRDDTVHTPDARPNMMCGDNLHGCVHCGAGHNDWSPAATLSRHILNSICGNTARNQRVQGPNWHKLGSLCLCSERAPAVVPRISGRLCIYARDVDQS
jgi:hypothetical protein